MSKIEKSIEDQRKSLTEAMSDQSFEKEIQINSLDLTNFLKKREEDRKIFRKINFVVG